MTVGNKIVSVLPPRVLLGRRPANHLLSESRGPPRPPNPHPHSHSAPRATQVHDEWIRYQQSEKEKLVHDFNKTFMLNQVKEEQKTAELNSQMLNTAWRTIMRKLKLEELKDEVHIVKQTHEKEVDRKDAIMSNLEQCV